MAVRENHEYCPPHGMNASLYVRPVLFGSGPQLGLKPAAEYTFLVFVVPIGGTPPSGAAVAPRRRLTHSLCGTLGRRTQPGGYYGASPKAVPALIVEDFDRSAPRGMGPYKAAGNYAPAMLPNQLAAAQGCPITLYLDAQTRQYGRHVPTGVPQHPHAEESAALLLLLRHPGWTAGVLTSSTRPTLWR